MNLIAVFPIRVEADLARGALDAAGIYAVVAADDAGGQNPGLDYSRGVAVLVREADLITARQVLNDATHPTNQTHPTFLRRASPQAAPTLALKYSIVLTSPSSSCTFGSQPRSVRARVMSGRRCLGSSVGSGL
jgi:hypothetical protein